MRGISWHDGHRRAFWVGVAVAGLLLAGRLFAPAPVAAEPVGEPTIRTETIVNCGTKLLLPGERVLCTLRVRNLDAETPAPSGTVQLETNGGEIPPSCKLVPLGSTQALCLPTYIAGPGGAKTITASYGGDEAHLPSAGQGIVNVSATATSVTCHPEVLAVGESSTCTAKVENAGAGPNGLAGTVVFESSKEAQFAPASCRVESTPDGIATCSTKFSPKIGGTHLVTALYAGDGTHPDSHGSESVGVRGTSVKLVCNPESVATGGKAVCSARVINEGLGSASMTGTVRFESSGEGSFSPFKCSLLPLPGNTGGFCVTSYIPEAGGVHVIRGIYSGDAMHPPADDGKAQVTATSRATTTAFECTPGSPRVNTPATCVARVHDDSAQPSPPTGSVLFTSDVEEGEFLPAICNLVEVNSEESSCSASYIPKIAASQLLTASYRGDKVHNPSAMSKRLIHVTTTTVACGESTPLEGTNVCTVAVRDVEPDATMPTGSVHFTSSTAGTFGQASCTLVPFGSNGGICLVSYVPKVVGEHAISAFYDTQEDNDPAHEGSFGTTAFIVRR
jgi:hypothetical protein